MHSHSLEKWRHCHEFSVNNDKAERRTKYVLILTAITMVVEIVAGSYYGSMALLADGWHMGTHVAAFMITIFAYRFARNHADNPAYSFGTGKDIEWLDTSKTRANKKCCSYQRRLGCLEISLEYLVE